MKKIILLAAVLIAGVLYGLSWLPQEVEINVSGQLTNKETDETSDDTLKVSGKIYTPWFSYGTFKGTVSFENNDSLSSEFDGKNTVSLKKDNGWNIYGGVGMEITDYNKNGCSFGSDAVSEGETRKIINVFFYDDDSHSVMAEVFTNPEDFDKQVNYFFST